MVPQDQQLEVASPGMMTDELDLASPSTIRHIHHGRSSVAPPDCIRPGREKVAPWLERTSRETIRARADAVSHDCNFSGQECPLHTGQAENEVPQPHDFVEFGFTKTKPCCINVSW